MNALANSKKNFYCIKIHCVLAHKFIQMRLVLHDLAMSDLLTELGQPVIHILHGRIHAGLVVWESNTTSWVEYVRGINSF
jgi:hypothetical protein